MLQSFTWEKSPVVVICDTISVAVPTFVTMTSLAPVLVPTG